MDTSSDALRTDASKTVSRIVLSGGGMGGIALIGAHKALTEKGYIFRDFTGTSIGALFALLYSIGLNDDTLARLAENFEYKLVEDLQVLGLLENFGLDRGRKIRYLLQEIVRIQTGNGRLTFREHYNLTGKILRMTTFCVEEDIEHILDVIRTPDLPVVQGVMMSISVPWLLAAVRIKGLTFIDGGFHNPFPIHLFPSKGTIGLKLCNNRIQNVSGNAFIDFTTNLVSSLLYQVHRKTTTGYDGNYVCNISTGVNMFDIHLTLEQKKALMERGYQSVLEQHH